MILADEPNIADWISSVGQALGALFTAAAVIVALWISHRDGKQRRADDLSRLTAHARLVRVKSVKLFDATPTVKGDAQNELHVLVCNYGDRPILGVELLAWTSFGDTKAQVIPEPQWRSVTEEVFPGRTRVAIQPRGPLDDTAVHPRGEPRAGSPDAGRT
ncbi:hypothetical protein Ade02nite_60410 [Paractinoplanes deccanensis]|uniref:PH domain-containing protein n=1 Tax=Paractinoplanes deccanensis TaxID=113561 RepID=A0ABQ3YC97_9ACTN|nr:hypothetical protein [Actinoplanes deccanensis]GID77400.1 hypothetical protein Ade02nite_60410 [Actinoplanes deccanensis]